MSKFLKWLKIDFEVLLKWQKNAKYQRKGRTINIDKQQIKCYNNVTRILHLYYICNNS